MFKMKNSCTRQSTQIEAQKSSIIHKDKKEINSAPPGGHIVEQS